jgi:long-chain acyl-CoA synthetase
MEPWYLCSKPFLFVHLEINRPEWIIADYGCAAYSLASVALYDTLGADTAEFIINHSEIPMIATSADKIPILLKLSGKCPNLKIIISMDPLDKSHPTASGHVLQQWATEKDVILYTMSEVEQLGAKAKISTRPPQPDDVATICYTSGTTGNPKGAILSHGNLVAISRAVEQTGINDLGPQDTYISYLPLAHIYERCGIVQALKNGCKIGFYRGDAALLVEDLTVLKPTIFPSVPRLYNRIYDKIMGSAVHSGSFIKATLFKRALASKVAHLKSTGLLTHSLWDRLVFNKVKALFGGNLRIMVSASAPISPEVIEFMRAVFGCHFLEAYGQTECTGGLTITLKDDYTPKHVGPPLTW